MAEGRGIGQTWPKPGSRNLLAMSSPISHGVEPRGLSFSHREAWWITSLTALPLVLLFRGTAR